MDADNEQNIIDLEKVESKEKLVGFFEASEERKADRKRQQAIRSAKAITESAIFGRYGGQIPYGRVEVIVPESLKELKGRLSKMNVQDVQFEANQLEKLLAECKKFPEAVKNAIAKEVTFYGKEEGKLEREHEYWKEPLKRVADAIPYIEQTIQIYQLRLNELKPLIDQMESNLKIMQACTEKANEYIRKIEKLIKETWFSKPEKPIPEIADLLYAWYNQSLLFQKAKEQYLLGGGAFSKLPNFPKNPLDDFLKTSPIRGQVERAYFGLIQHSGGA